MPELALTSTFPPANRRNGSPPSPGTCTTCPSGTVSCRRTSPSSTRHSSPSSRGSTDVTRACQSLATAPLRPCADAAGVPAPSRAMIGNAAAASRRTRRAMLGRSMLLERSVSSRAGARERVNRRGAAAHGARASRPAGRAGAEAPAAVVRDGRRQDARRAASRGRAAAPGPGGPSRARRRLPAGRRGRWERTSSRSRASSAGGETRPSCSERSIDSWATSQPRAPSRELEGAQAQRDARRGEDPAHQRRGPREPAAEGRNGDQQGQAEQAGRAGAGDQRGVPAEVGVLGRPPAPTRPTGRCGRRARSARPARGARAGVAGGANGRARPRIRPAAPKGIRERYWTAASRAGGSWPGSTGGSARAVAVPGSSSVKPASWITIALGSAASASNAARAARRTRTGRPASRQASNAGRRNGFWASGGTGRVERGVGALGAGLAGAHAGVGVDDHRQRDPAGGRGRGRQLVGRAGERLQLHQEPLPLRAAPRRQRGHRVHVRARSRQGDVEVVPQAVPLALVGPQRDLADGHRVPGGELLGVARVVLVAVGAAHAGQRGGGQHVPEPEAGLLRAPPGRRPTDRRRRPRRPSVAAS